MEISNGVHWVGVIDWNVRTFHGNTYSTKRGTTYNAYLIVDDKITLVDTVHAEFKNELIDNIKKIIDPKKIDYIVANHVESDHSGALPEILKLCPDAKIFGTAKCKEGLEKHYSSSLNFQVVKTNDTLKLGKKTLSFVEAAMLHWPDSMFTYIVEDQILLPNDAFGQHYATSKRFDDEVDQWELMDEAAKYYGNILWPLSTLVLKKIQEVKDANIPIKMIAPSHGIVWRKDPIKIINAYTHWANNENNKKIIIVYETMWGSTFKMASDILSAISDSGVEVKLFDIAKADRTEIIKEMLESKGYMIGSSTHDNNMLPAIAGFLHFLKGLKPKNRIACAFGSYGWAGGAVKEIETMFKETGIEIAQPGLSIKYVPDENERKNCYEFGKSFAKKIKER